MAQYDDNNAICTKDHIVEVGGKYQYKESLPSCLFDVEVLEDNSNDKYVHLKLKILRSWNDEGKVGEVFEASTIRERIAYSGMWRLFDEGEYQW